MSVNYLKIGDSFLFKNKKEYTVKERCVIVTGKWYCVTCNVPMPNISEKNNHISTGDHTLVWCCPEHGYEQSQ